MKNIAVNVLVLNLATCVQSFGILGQKDFPYSEFFSSESKDLIEGKMKSHLGMWILYVALVKMLVLKLKTVVLINFVTVLYRWKDI